MDAAREFTPRTWAQQRFLVSDVPELLYTGPLGSLKSRTLTEKADLRCRRHPDSRVVLARKQRVDLGLTTLKTLFDYTITPEHKAWGWHPGAEGGATLDYPNGSQILCIGLDNPGKMLSAEFDLILIDQAEELTAEEWDAASGRLRHVPRLNELGERAYRQIAGACNPSDGGHFLFRKFRPDLGSRIQKAETVTKLPTGAELPIGRVLRECLVADPRDGRDLLPPDYLARLEGFKGRYYDRFVLGKWVSFTGTVYGDVWDPNLHIVPRPSSWPRGFPPADWPRYRSIDFGYTNPFVCQWWARDRDGVLWRYRELYMTRRTVPEHKRQIIELEELELQALNEHDLQSWDGHDSVPPIRRYLNIGLSVSDHDAGDRALLEDGNDATGRAIVTAPANKDVRSGIQLVYQALAPYTVGEERRSRLRFVRDALVEADELLVADEHPTCTEEEILRYRYQKPIDSVTTSAPREEPYKQHDHGCDATRYLLATLKDQEIGEVVGV